VFEEDQQNVSTFDVLLSLDIRNDVLFLEKTTIYINQILKFLKRQTSIFCSSSISCVLTHCPIRSWNNCRVNLYVLVLHWRNVSNVCVQLSVERWGRERIGASNFNIYTE